MLFRFSLYGFLKNQRYFEPFLMLVFLDRGISFFQIGILVAIRELVVNLLELPSGAIADGWSRRGSMVFSFVSYISSFVVFALAGEFYWFAAGMVLFGIGDSFRTGTHKAMIFEWLRRQSRESERTEVYGFTRSWSQIGSALSGIVAAIAVILTSNYSAIFIAATIPYLLNIVNLATYPKELDGPRESNVRQNGFLKAVQVMTGSLAKSVKDPPLRRLMTESMAWEGVLHALKDYLQPAMVAFIMIWFMNENPLASSTVSGDTESTSAFAPIHLPVAAGGDIELPPDSSALNIRETAIMVGIVYPVLFLLSSLASRRSFRYANRFRSLDAAAAGLWKWQLLLYLLIVAGDLLLGITVVIFAFVALHVLMNLWRPILVSRYDEVSSADEGATILSIESQSQRLATLIIAPILGLAMDWTAGGPGAGTFWPLGAAGAAAALVIMLIQKYEKPGRLSSGFMPNPPADPTNP